MPPKRKSSQPVKKATYGVVDRTGASAVKASRTDSASPELRELLDQASFYVHLKCNLVDKNKKSATHVELGGFRVSIRVGEKPIPEVKEYWLYIANNVEGKHFLYQEQRTMLRLYYLVKFSTKSVAALISKMAVPNSTLIYKHAVHLQFTVGQHRRHMYVQILVDRKRLVDMNCWESFINAGSRLFCSWQAVLALSGHTETPGITSQTVGEPKLPSVPSFHHDIKALYREIKAKSYMDLIAMPQLDANISSDGVVLSVGDRSKKNLLCKLRPYQKDAVRWMIAKEQVLYEDEYEADMKELFSLVPSASLYMNADSGALTAGLPSLTLGPGGILADEMGLGKTVEVLCCMVCNPRRDIKYPKPLDVAKHIVMNRASRELITSWADLRAKELRTAERRAKAKELALKKTLCTHSYACNLPLVVQPMHDAGVGLSADIPRCPAMDESGSMVTSAIAHPISGSVPSATTRPISGSVTSATSNAISDSKVTVQPLANVTAKFFCGVSANPFGDSTVNLLACATEMSSCSVSTDRLSGTAVSPEAGSALNPLADPTGKSLSVVPSSPLHATVESAAGSTVNPFDGSTINPLTDATVQPSSVSANPPSRSDALKPPASTAVNTLTSSTVNPLADDTAKSLSGVLDSAAVDATPGSTDNPVPCITIYLQDGTAVNSATFDPVNPVTDITVNPTPSVAVNPSVGDTANFLSGVPVNLIGNATAGTAPGGTVSPVACSAIHRQTGTTVNSVILPVSPVADISFNSAIGISVNALAHATVNSLSDMPVKRIDSAAVAAVPGRADNPVSCNTINPQAGTALNSVTVSVNSAACITVNPSTGITVNPEAGIAVNSSAGTTVNSLSAMAANLIGSAAVGPAPNHTVNSVACSTIKPQADDTTANSAVPVNPAACITVNPADCITVNPADCITVNPKPDCTVKPVTCSAINPQADTTVNSPTVVTVNPAACITVNQVYGSTVSPADATAVNSLSGVLVHPVGSTAVDPVPGSMVNPVACSAISLPAGTTVSSATVVPVNPAAGITVNPAAGVTVNAAAGITDNSATGITVNPVAGVTISLTASATVNSLTGVITNPGSDVVNSTTDVTANSTSCSTVGSQSGFPEIPAAGVTLNPSADNVAIPLTVAAINSGVPVSADVGIQVDVTSGSAANPLIGATGNSLGVTVNPMTTNNGRLVAGAASRRTTKPKKNPAELDTKMAKLVALLSTSAGCVIPCSCSISNPQSTSHQCPNSALSAKPSKFECVCGEGSGNKIIVQCCECSLQQHSQCVGYDIVDPYRGDYKCPHCHVTSEPIKSGATLIIAPSSIRYQWREEIHKHIGASHLKVMDYNGVTAKTYIQPAKLARQDIVITTYEVLKQELKSTVLPHSNSDTGRKFRKPKRFMAVPSPLTCVEWWRVCLDEAQMVESVTTRTSEMALKLSAINRWCVTGTPINTGVQDLYGLLVFLGVKPFYAIPMWEGFLYRPYCFGQPNNLFTLLRHVMWRTCKADVREQIGLPPQTEIRHDVMFSAVEEVFYRQQYSRCRQRCLKLLSKFENKDVRLDSLSRWNLSELMDSLLGMRQACCHPQVVTDKGQTAVSRKVMLTIDQVLDQLTLKFKNQCQEAHRAIVAALNGQAACHILKNEYSQAVAKYLEVLKPSTKYEGITTDPLQVIHASHNLRDVVVKASMTKPVVGVGFEELEAAKQLTKKYLEKADNLVNVVIQDYQDVNERVFSHDLMIHKGDSSASLWFVEIFEYEMELMLKLEDGSSDLLNHLVTAVHHLRNGHHIASLRSLDGLIYYLVSNWDKLRDCHSKACGSMRHLVQLSKGSEILTQVVSCCLRPTITPSAAMCDYCKGEEILRDYEYTLFDFSDQSAEDEERKGTWADSLMETVLKSLISYLKLNLSSRRSKESGERREREGELLDVYLRLAAKHMKLLADMKKQFKVMRQLWRALRDRIASVDELSMATLRFTLRQPGETNPEGLQHLVAAYEVEDLYQKQLTDMAAGQSDIQNSLRQLTYLRHLASKPVDPVSGNKEPCPICKQPMGHGWAVLTCCHSFCMNCTQILSQREMALTFLPTFKRIIRCAVCREDCRHADVSYVSSGRAVDLSNQNIVVKGNYSSKVTEVIRCLKTIEQNDPNAKTLIFSTWSSLLDVVARALDKNGIVYRQLKGIGSGKNQQQAINCFRHVSGIEALLMPISSGANGLNLTEATHVLLLEPLLNPGKEAQAVGRIHRIGQTKPTFVHKFIVKHTIEEHIDSIMSTLPDTTTSDPTVEEVPLTLADLAAIFHSEL